MYNQEWMKTKTVNPSYKPYSQSRSQIILRSLLRLSSPYTEILVEP